MLLDVQAAFIDRQEDLIVDLLQSLVDIVRDRPEFDVALQELNIPERLWRRVAI